jgi:hypothetical protein
LRKAISYSGETACQFSTSGSGAVWFVILSKLLLRIEESGRAARRVAFFATQSSRVWLASLQNCTTTRFREILQIARALTPAVAFIRKLQRFDGNRNIAAGHEGGQPGMFFGKRLEMLPIQAVPKPIAQCSNWEYP